MNAVCEKCFGKTDDPRRGRYGRTLCPACFEKQEPLDIRAYISRFAMIIKTHNLSEEQNMRNHIIAEFDRMTKEIAELEAKQFRWIPVSDGLPVVPEGKEAIPLMIRSTMFDVNMVIFYYDNLPEDCLGIFNTYTQINGDGKPCFHCDTLGKVKPDSEHWNTITHYAYIPKFDN